MPSSLKTNSLNAAMVIGCLSLCCIGCSGNTEATGRHASVDVSAAEVTTNSADVGWPSLFGPDGNCTVSDSGIRTQWTKAGPPVLWKQPIGLGYSSVVGDERRVIVQHRIEDEELIECRATETGYVLWTHRYSSNFSPGFKYTSGPIPTATIDNGRVYAVGAEGEVNCRDFASGRLEWRCSLVKDFGGSIPTFGYGASPFVDGELLILLAGGTESGAGIIALDKRTGKEVWRATDHASCYATPIARDFFGQRLLFCMTDFGLVTLEAKTGRVVWEIPFRSKVPDTENSVTCVVVDDMVLVTQYAIGSMCLQVSPDGQYKELWRKNRGLDSQYTNLISSGTSVFGFSPRSRRYTEIDIRTGEILSRHLTDTTRGMAIKVNDTFIVFGDKSRLISFERTSDGWEPGSTSDYLLDDQCFCMPTLINGRLFVRDEHNVVCFDMRKPGAE